MAKPKTKATKQLTKSALLLAVVDSVGEGTTRKDVKGVLDALVEIGHKELKKNGVFVLPGIGRLVLVSRKARIGRNPATGEAIKIPAKKVVKFRVAKAAKDAIVPPKKK